MNVDALACEIRAINFANGWNPVQHHQWDDDVNKFPALIALIHSEISEADYAYSNEGLDAFAEELADVAIRILDTVGGLTDNFQDIYTTTELPPPCWTTPENLLCLHRWATAALESYRKNSKLGFLLNLACLLCDTWRLGEQFLPAGPNFIDVINAKLDKNRRRGYRHGGKRI